MKRLRLGHALRKVAEHFSGREGAAKGAFSFTALMRAFTEATDLMIKENRLLEAENVTEATALLPEKTARIEKLAALVEQARQAGVGAENLPASFRQVQSRFADIAAQNRVLLQRAVVTQEAVMQFLIESAMEESRHGYGRTGEAGADTSRANISLNNRV